MGLDLAQPLGGNSLPSTYAFASVEAREGSGTLRVRMQLDGEGQESEGLSIKTTPGALRLRAALQGPTSAWWLMKVCLLSPVTESAIFSELVCVISLAQVRMLAIISFCQIQNVSLISTRSRNKGLDIVRVIYLFRRVSRLYS